MDPNRLFPRDRQQRPADRPLEQLNSRLEATEHQLRRLHNTLQGIARESDITIGCPCDRCDRSYLLVADGKLICPHCGYQQSM
ncbi:hypothetical protein D8Y22_18570 [Salinadaptatus halalkaliphilus]|uniref:Uncharacterized protein n=1 Tax=Salinadaptatus halalkaliphilus TaxID=2419781 RepID=A0A4S3TIF0_9EURY|nr:hypothetical protein [Salinadaptatus halalkaliphilus]THE63310.1 hypothetical protein D8Y22_18570 [Salinadaptatus halalkaliphilus]